VTDESNRQDTSRFEVEQLERMRARLKLLEVEKGFTKDARDLLQKNLDLQSQTVQVKREEVAYMTKAMVDLERLEEGSTERQKVINQLKAMGLKADKESLIKAMERLRLEESTLTVQKDSNAAADKLLKSTLGISDGWKGSATGALATSAAILLQKKGMGTLLTSLKGSAGWANILMSTLSKIVEMSILTAKQYDKAAASIRQIAGKGTGIEQAAYDSHRAMLEFGVSIEEAGASAQALYRDMAIFSHSLEADQNLLRNQAALLNEVGIELGTTAKMMNILDKGLGMSAPEIKDYTAKLYDMSEQLKVPPDVIFKDWQASSKELMKYGDGMVDVLEGLEHQSKNTGLAVGDLLGIAKQFDQFDTAGEAVGRLNAILGGPYLNAIDMVYMTEDQRIEALRETISLSGQVWKDMGRHEQQAIAAAAGISDMAQAAQLFGGTQTEFTDAAANQEALAERAKQAQAAMDNIARAMEGIAVAAAPLIDNVILPFSHTLTAIAASPVGATFMSAAAALIFFGGVFFTVLKYKAASIKADKVQELLDIQLSNAKKAKAMATEAETAAKGKNTTATHVNNQAEVAGYTKTKGGILIRNSHAASLQKDAVAKVGNAVSTDVLAASEQAEVVVQKQSMFMRLRAWLPTTALAVANWTLAASFVGVGVAIAGVVIAGVAMYQWVKKMSPVGKTFAVILGIMAIAAAAFAIAASLGTAAVGIVSGLGAVGIAGGLGAIGAVAFDNGGNVGGQKGKAQAAVVHGGETVLPTHKKSDDQAVADAEAKGQLSLTKNKGQEQLIGAINNLVAKLNTMITQSEERAKGGGKEKAVEVTMELDRDKVGEATASWLEEKYGWTGA